MRARTWLNVGLACLVLGLALFFHLRPKIAEESFALSTLAPAQVTRIQVDTPNMSELVLEKGARGWMMTAPFAARTDATQVERLIALLNATSKSKLPAGDLARYDLDRPKARVTLNGQAFSFGTINPVTREQYVATGDAVYLIKLDYLAALPTHPANIVSHRLFADDETPVAFAFAGFRVAQADGKWLLQPAPERISQDDVGRWAEQWRLASSTLTDSYHRAPSGEIITVTLSGGQQVLLRVLQAQPELLLLRTDEQLRYHIPQATARVLLAPPAAAEKP